MPYWWSKERIKGTSGGVGGLTRHIKGLSGYAAVRQGILLTSVSKLAVLDVHEAVNGGGGLDV